MKAKSLLYIILIAVIVIGGFTSYYILKAKTGKVTYVPTQIEEHVKGSPNAKVTITEFSDFQCPYCGRAQPTIEQILKDYDGKVKLVFRHFPLNFHQYAFTAAEASECAADQGKFWEYHDTLFKNQNALTTSDLKGYAARLGLDTEKFNSCLDSGTMKDRVNSNSNEGRSLGVTGTPSFFINGQMVVGAQPYSAFKSVIDRMLS